MNKKNQQKKLLNWFATSKLLNFPRNLILKTIFRGVDVVWNAKNHYDSEFLAIRDLIMEIKTETEMLLSDWEAFQIFRAVKQTSKINGDIAEVGVYRGGSSKLICEAKGNKRLHLFDTFEGLPAPIIEVEILGSQCLVVKT
jgi:hypothetical protein